MALNEQDRSWVREQISTAIAARRSGWQIVLQYLPIAVMVAIAIFVVTQWTAYVEFRTHTNDRLDVVESKVNKILDRLDSIDGKVNQITSDFTKQSLINHAVLPSSGFKQSLPELGNDLAAARKEKIKIPSAAINEIGDKLLTAKDAPSFWPTAGEFITYRSQISLQDYEQLLRPDLPNCVDKPPIPMKITMDAAAEMAHKEDVERNRGTRFTPALYENCRFTLDSPQEVASIPELGQGRSYILTFRRCQIVYRGGPIRIFVPRPHPTAITGYGPTRSDVFLIQGQTITFERCLFLFDIKSRPGPEGQSLTQQLLAQSGQTLTVKFSAAQS